MTASIHLDTARKEFRTLGNTHVTVDDLSLNVPEGSFTTFVDPSDCKKTATLRMSAGLETPTSGTVPFGDEDMTGLPPWEYNASMVFQSIALYPHMPVRENIDYGLKVHGVPKVGRGERIDETTEVLQIEAQLERIPAELSGGQQQHVTLDNAFVQDPDVLLLDELMSDLDAKLKSGLHVEIQRLHQKLGTTVVYVTRDQIEATTTGDQVVLLRDDKLAQVDPPGQLFDYPSSEYVTQFIDMPSTNVVDCAVEHRDGETVLVGPGFELSLPVGVDAPTAGHVRLGIRPQYLDVGSAGTCRFPVDVEIVETLGTEPVVHDRLEDGTPFDVVSGTVSDAVAGDRPDVSFDLAGAFVFGEDSETMLFGSECAGERSSSPTGTGGVTP